MRIGTVLVVVWLVIGTFAASQRGYFSGNDSGCAKVSTTALTIVAGPLNYVGVDPKIGECVKPQPSR